MVDKRTRDLNTLSAASIDDDNTFLLADRTGQAESEGLSIAELKNLTVSAINVRQFGAIGDGIANDTAAIQATFDRSVALGVGNLLRPCVYLDAGRYKITDTIDIQDRISFFGAGRESTIISFEPTVGNKPALQLKDTSPYHWFGDVRDLTITVPPAVTYDGLTGILLQEATRTRVERVVVNFDGHSVKDHVGIHISGREQIAIVDCSLLAPVGIRLSGTLDNTVLSKITFLSDSTGGSGLPNTLPFAAIAADDTAIVQWLMCRDLAVVKKHYVFFYNNNSAAAGGGIFFDNVRTESGPDPARYEFSIKGVAHVIDQVTISNSRLQSAQKGLDIDLVDNLLVSATKFESASREVLKYRDVSGGTFTFDEQCSYLAGCTADISGSYQPLTLDGLHDSKTWPVEWFSGTTVPAISRNFSNYFTANATPTTITGFNVTKSPTKGQRFSIVLDANTSVQHTAGATAGGIKLDNGLNFTPPNGGVLEVIYNGSQFIEASRATL